MGKLKVLDRMSFEECQEIDNYYTYHQNGYVVSGSWCVATGKRLPWPGFLKRENKDGQEK